MSEQIAIQMGIEIKRIKEVNEVDGNSLVIRIGDGEWGVVCGFGKGQYVNFRTDSGTVEYAKASKPLQIRKARAS